MMPTGTRRDSFLVELERLPQFISVFSYAGRDAALRVRSAQRADLTLAETISAV